MNKLAILGVTLVGAAALIGLSCSSDKKDEIPAGTVTGGSGGEGTKVGGSGTAGGSTGGTNSPGNGLATPNGYFTQGTLKGSVWTAKDTDGSTITLDPASMCVNGTAIKIPNNDAGTPDYSGAWGVDLGWNLNQDPGASAPQNAADLSALSNIKIALAGAAGLIVRVQLEVKSGSTSTYYCTSLQTVETEQTVALTSLVTNCWPGGTPQDPFDPATMQPISMAVQVVTDVGKDYPFNFCITSLSLT